MVHAVRIDENMQKMEGDDERKAAQEDCDVDKKNLTKKKEGEERRRKKRKKKPPPDEADRDEWRFAVVALAPKSPENGARYRCVAVEDRNENGIEIPEKVMRLDDEELRAQTIQQCTHSA